MMQFSSLDFGAIAVGLVIVLVAVVLYLRKHQSSQLADVLAAVNSHLPHHHPAAPAAPDAVAPPPAPAAAAKASAEPKPPSADSGGTPQVVVVPADAAAVASHSALDKVIADAEAMIADARAKKKAVDDALAALKAAVN